MGRRLAARRYLGHDPSINANEEGEFHFEDVEFVFETDLVPSKLWPLDWVTPSSAVDRALTSCHAAALTWGDEAPLPRAGSAHGSLGQRSHGRRPRLDRGKAIEAGSNLSWPLED